MNLADRFTTPLTIAYSFLFVLPSDAQNTYIFIVIGYNKNSWPFLSLKHIYIHQYHIDICILHAYITYIHVAIMFTNSLPIEDL
jgi:hypothetical protein